MKIKREQTPIPKPPIFVGREAEQSFFWEKYDKLSEWSEDWDVTVLNFYGMGGIGKSFLLRKLYRDLNQRNAQDGNYRSNVYLSVNASDADTDIMEAIVFQLQSGYDFQFPMYEAAIAALYAKTGRQQYLRTIEKLSEKSFWLGTALEMSAVHAVSSIIAAIYKSLEGCSVKIRERLQNEKQKLEGFQEMAPDEIYKLLPELLTQDLQANTADNLYPTVFFLDKYENFRTGNSGIDLIDFKHKWIREHLIRNTSGTIWVFSSREKLEWEQEDSDWAGSVFNYQVSELASVEMLDYFHEMDMQVDELAAELEDLTQGVPLYMYLCHEIYEKNKDKEKIDISIFRGGHGDLLECYMENLDAVERQLLFVLSCLGEWESPYLDELLQAIDFGHYKNEYEILLRKSYMTVNHERYMLHPVIQSNVFRYCSEDMVRSVVDAMESLGIADVFGWKYPAYVRCTVSLVKTEEELQALSQKEWLVMYHLGAQNQLESFEQCYKELDSYISENLMLTNAYLVFASIHVTHLRLAGYLQAAKKYINRLIKMNKSALEANKPIHPGLIYNLKELKAQVLDAEKKYPMAARIRNEINQEIRNAPLSTQIAIKHNMVTSLCALGEYDKAIALCNEVLKEREKTIDENPEDYVRALLVMLEILLAVNKNLPLEMKHSDILTAGRDVLHDARALLGMEHFLMVDVIGKIGDVYMDFQKWDNAIHAYEKAEEIAGKIYGEQSKVAADIQYNIALCKIQNEEFEDGYQMLEELERRSDKNSDQSSLIHYRINLEKAIHLSQKDRHEEAYQIVHDSAQACEKEYGPSFSTTLKLKYEMAVELAFMEQYVKARGVLEVIVPLVEKMPDYDAEFLWTARNLLKICVEKIE